VQGVEAHIQKVWFVENPGKIPKNVAKISENLVKILKNQGKLPKYLGKTPDDPGKMGATLVDFKKWGPTFVEK